MHIILVYDVNEARVGKICKYMKRYLPHVQNSVFEGELTEAKLEIMKSGLRKIMDENVDSVLIWAIRDARWAGRQTLGVEKKPITVFF